MALLLLVSSIATPLLSASPVSALTTAASKAIDLDWQIQSNWYLQAMTTCVKDPGWRANRAGAGWNLNEADMKSGNWLSTNPVSDDGRDGTVGFYMRGTLSDIGDDGKMSCASNENELTKKALASWGVSPLDLLCGAGIVRRDNNTDCLQGNKDFQLKDGAKETAQDLLKKYVVDNVYGGQAPQLTDAMQYLLYRQTLLNGCAYGAQPKSSDPGGANVYEIAKVSRTQPSSFVGPPSPNQVFVSSEWYIGGVPANTGDRWLWTNPDTAKTCGDLMNAIKPGTAYTEAYKRWLITNKDAAEPTAGNCLPGSTDPKCVTKSSCAIDSIGWIVCPVMGFLGQITDTAFAFLATNFLSVDVNLFNTSSTTYTAWSVMRNFANVAFVIAFLIIIYAQITSSGISNYGIKKMLPRLIIAAVLVNTSYFICQLAVDLSNILGYGIKQLFDGIGTSIKTASDTATDATGNGLGVAVLVTALIAGGVTVIFALSMPVLIAAVVALLVIAMILLARKALIVLLIVIAPLAFVAYLLPNTEHLFKKWQKMFTTLLLVFPIVSALFGAATLAAKIIKDANPNDNMTALIAVGVAAMPLFLVPALLKGATSAAGTLGAKLNGWGDKAHGRIGGKVNETSRLGQFNKYHKAEADRRRGLIQAGAYSGSNKNPLNWGRNATSRINKGFNNAPISGRFGNRSAAAGFAAADQIDAKDIADQQLIVEREIQTGTIKKGETGNALQQAIAKNDTVRARAITNVLFQTAGGRNEFHDALKGIEADPKNQAQVATLKAHTSRNHGDMDTKDAAISLWSHEAPNVGLSAVETQTGTYEINDNKLAGQSKKGLVQAYKNHVLDSATAARILGDKDMERNLKPAERDFLLHVSGMGYARTTPTPGGPPPPPPPPLRTGDDAF